MLLRPLSNKQSIFSSGHNKLAVGTEGSESSTVTARCRRTATASMLKVLGPCEDLASHFQYYSHNGNLL